MIPQQKADRLSQPDFCWSYMARPSFLRTVFNDALLTPEVLDHSYAGGGSVVDPFICEFVPNDPQNPQAWRALRRWTICIAAAGTTFVVSFCSSTYTGAEAGLAAEFGVSEAIVNLGLALFLVGYIIGPLIWGPMSEVYGRRNLMIGTLALLTAFNIGAAEANDMPTLLVCRFLGSIFGSSPMTNAGGAVADLFSAAERGVPVAVFAAGPFMGPVLGPIVGGFAGDYAGWRWVMRVMAIVSGVLWVLGTLLIPETYAPVILERRAKALEKATGNIFRTRLQMSGSRPTLARSIRIALSRPWALLCREPIVTIMSIYMALVYGTLYMMFGAFPIVYQKNRGWSAGEGGLAFLGLAVGIVVAIGLIIPDDVYRFKKIEREAIARNELGAAPEARLPPGIVGSVMMPISLFWFAWTNGPDDHYIVSIIASVPFGAGMLLVFFSLTQYLVDSYTIYAASVIAGSGIVRSLFGAAFPMFTTKMYEDLGIHWASSVPAFLSLACVPFPLLFHRYGARIRERCKYSRQAAEALAKIKLHETVTASDSRDEAKLRQGPLEA
ncbi:major facilitator superfamily protein [Hirsutella rhossiliensis]|uniref:Major facilitator superfamily domain-containing protein n=1 Tax=Hirsutella rhossiliensis TaxID=111463 RepID=A0A9P8MQV2_9HYPO|nr:major facilitator superfamily domain-containing protein [Hirsutella rhossiliensis]KAH0960598.1 major facilitator superfamily domain-containing protein [Hirsutella rhossiliensis]